MSTILIADDEARIRRLVSDFLKRDGHTIVEAADGKEALNILENRRPGLDMAILDVMMPGMDGFEVLRELREQEHGETHLPVMLLTARAEDADQVRGLEGGADDYVTKPFSVPELMARVKTNLRRAPEITPTKELVFEDIRMDLVEKKVFRGENYIHLGPTEFRLLKMLLETPRKVFSRETLLKTVWGDNIYVESRTVDVHIRRLRKSLNDFGPDYIRTVRATGYAIDINPVGDQEEPADN